MDLIKTGSSRAQYPDYRVPSGCAVFGILNESGSAFSGSKIIDGIEMMHDRSNGLGGGFAAYGIYPQYKDEWAFHILYDDKTSKDSMEDMLKKTFDIVYSEEIPTKRSSAIIDPPIIYRYFLKLKDIYALYERNVPVDDFNEDDFIVDFVLKMNFRASGAYIISSGKNMGIFKGVGFPEDIGRYFRIDEYSGYLWTAHGRFPTNSIGWWGGAHPFGLLNWSVVHNGEISSYGRNQRYVASLGYQCSLSTDTEVLTYLFDLLARKKNIDIEIMNMILAAPLWEQIERMGSNDKALAKTLRIIYGGALVNGPFSIIVGHNDFMYALNDRIKLRPMVAARKDSYLFVSSEESAIIKVCPEPDTIWRPEGGIPVIGFVNKKDK
ncbi:MAG: glutamine amidotransferase family protein [Actinobacteria bacterium]|nr:glutamine amidotransferase family protein [Actinomycetota bacterium]